MSGKTVAFEFDEMRRDFEKFECEAHRLTGWPPAYPPIYLDPQVPWDYGSIASNACRDAQHVLDIGTGGGEVLTQVLDGNECRAVAIEEWHVNAPVAAAALRNRAAVVQAASHHLPFCGAAFDLVLSRHTAIAPEEIGRVLTEPGRFITQQVGPDNWPELSEFFPDRTIYPDHYREYPERLEALGFSINQYEKYERRGRYTEPAHIAYLLAACVWEVPGFSVATHLGQLTAVARHMERHDGLVLTYTNYLLDASR